MKKLVVVAVSTAMAAAPALARSDTHISFGIYSPAPVIYQPTPVYYAPVRMAYVAPPYRPCPPRHHGWEHRRHFHEFADNGWQDWNYNRGYWSR